MARLELASIRTRSFTGYLPIISWRCSNLLSYIHHMPDLTQAQPIPDVFRNALENCGSFPFPTKLLSTTGLRTPFRQSHLSYSTSYVLRERTVSYLFHCAKLLYFFAVVIPSNCHLLRQCTIDLKCIFISLLRGPCAMSWHALQRETIFETLSCSFFLELPKDDLGSI